MQNKVVLITGSTSGIGLGVAQKFASKGAKLVISGFAEPGRVEQIKTELKAMGAAGVVYAPADLAIPEEIDAMFAKVKADYGGVDILVNNAGVQFVSPIESFPADKWESIIRINLTSSFYTMRNSIAFMKSRGFGRIINIASAHALVASPFKSAYVAAKHGLLGLTKSVALETAKDGITVNAICPGYVKTPLVLNQVADTAKARGISEEDVINNVLLAAQATKKFVEIEEIAELVYFLSTPGASSITGCALPIDGGWTAS